MDSNSSRLQKGFWRRRLLCRKNCFNKFLNIEIQVVKFHVQSICIICLSFSLFCQPQREKQFQLFLYQCFEFSFGMRSYYNFCSKSHNFSFESARVKKSENSLYTRYSDYSISFFRQDTWACHCPFFRPTSKKIEIASQSVHTDRHVLRSGTRGLFDVLLRFAHNLSENFNGLNKVKKEERRCLRPEIMFYCGYF